MKTYNTFMEREQPPIDEQITDANLLEEAQAKTITPEVKRYGPPEPQDLFSEIREVKSRDLARSSGLGNGPEPRKVTEGNLNGKSKYQGKR